MTPRPARCSRPIRRLPEREQPQAARLQDQRRRLRSTCYFGPEGAGGDREKQLDAVPIPGKGWFTILRLYGPLEAVVRQVLAAGRDRTAALARLNAKRALLMQSPLGPEVRFTATLPIA